MTSDADAKQRYHGLVRRITQDIRVRYKDIKEKLWTDYEGTGNYKESAAFWDGVIDDFFDDEDAIGYYTDMIKRCADKEIDLWKCKTWKDEMIKVLPIQLNRKIKDLSLIARLAMMDDTTFNKEEHIIEW